MRVLFLSLFSVFSSALLFGAASSKGEFFSFVKKIPLTIEDSIKAATKGEETFPLRDEKEEVSEEALPLNMVELKKMIRIEHNLLKPIKENQWDNFQIGMLSHSNQSSLNAFGRNAGSYVIGNPNMTISDKIKYMDELIAKNFNLAARTSNHFGHTKYFSCVLDLALFGDENDVQLLAYLLTAYPKETSKALILNYSLDDSFKETRLIRAIKSKNKKVINHFLKDKFKLNTPDLNGYTPLYTAFLTDEIWVFNALVAKKVNLKTKIKKDANIFGMILGSPFVSEDEQIKYLQILENAGCSITERNYFEHFGSLDDVATVLIKNKKHSLFQKMLEAFPALKILKGQIFKTGDIEAANIFNSLFPLSFQDKKILLHNACKEGNEKFVKFLIEIGAPLNTALTDSEENVTPLMIAVLASNINLVKLLVDSGENPNIPCVIGGGRSGTPLEIAIDGKSSVILAYLLSSPLIDVEKKAEALKESQLAMRGVVSLAAFYREKKIEDTGVLSLKLQSFPFLQFKEPSTKSFSDIYVGSVPEAVTGIVQRIKDAKSDYSKWVPSKKNTLLLYGPTGTGKTTLAYAIASESGLPFFKINSTEFESKWVGESQNNFSKVLKALYEFAEERDTKVVLFMDEIDAVLNTRSSSNESYHKSLVTVFLNYFGELPHDSKYSRFLDRIILIGATNYPDEMPLNVKSRFSYKIEIPNPNLETRIAITKHLLAQLSPDVVGLSEDDIYDICSEEFSDFNGRELKDIVSEAGDCAFRDSRSQILKKHIREAILRLKAAPAEAAQSGYKSLPEHVKHMYL